MLALIAKYWRRLRVGDVKDRYGAIKMLPKAREGASTRRG
jgi:hypothetical protein